MSIQVPDKITYDVTTPIVREGRTHWVPLGIAWGKMGDKGHQITVRLNSLPLDKNWEGSLMLFPRSDNGLKQVPDPSKKKDAKKVGTPERYADDDIPF